MQNTFVYSMDHGLGYILEEENETYKIKYKDKIIDNVNQFQFQFLNQDMIKFILDNKFEWIYDYQSLNRAEEYFENGNVINYYILGDSIVGKVEGHSYLNYNIKIDFINNKFKTNCDCPVKTNCKHSGAIFFQINHDLNNLIDVEEENNSNLKSLLDSYKLSKNDTEKIEYMILIKQNIKSEYDMKLLLDYVNTNYSKLNSAFLCYMIAYNDRLYNLFLSLNSNYHISKSIMYERKYMRSIINITNDSAYYYEPIFKKTIYFITNDKFYDAVIFILSSKGNIKAFSKALPALANYIDISDEIIDLLLKVAKNNIQYDNALSEFVRMILKNVNIDIKMKLYNALGDSIELTIDDVSEYPLDLQLDLLNKVRNCNLVLDYIYDNRDKFIAISESKLAILLYSIYNYLTENKKIIAKSIIELLDNNIYIMQLFNDVSAFKYLDEDFDLYSFFKYFNYKYEIYDDGEIIQTTIDLLFGDTYLFTIVLHDLKLNSILNNKIYIDRKKLCVEQIINKIINDSLFINEYKEIENKNKLIRQKNLIDKYNNNIDLLNEILNFKSYNESSLINLIPEIKYYYDDDKIDMSMQLKIGRDKLYIIKSSPELLDNIRNNNLVKYGKNLEFYHNINNFTDLSKKLIKLLMLTEGKTEYSKYENPRFIPLNGEMLDELLKIYINNNITINDNSYFVSLSNISFDVNVDNNYILSSHFNLDNTIITNDSIYYLDELSKQIYECKTDNNKINFYKFVLQNNGMDLSLVLDKFKNDIYSRFNNEIIVSENIKSDFKLSELIIDAYFDFDGKSISIETKIYKQNEEELELNKIDKIKLERFENYISNLGFVDNKITSEDNIYNFLIMDFSELHELCNVFLSDSIKNKTMAKFKPSAIHIVYGSKVMEAFSGESEYSEDELYQILASIKRRKKYVLLSDDRIVDINNDESKNYLDAIDDMKLDYKHLLTRKTIPIYQALKAKAYSENVEIDDYILNIIEEIKNFKNASFDIPKINGELREYQKEGFNFLKILSNHNLGGILADDMGLGKTLEIITLLMSDNTNKPSLVVCPKSLIFNWLNEFEKFDGNTKIICLIGNQNERHKLETKIKDEKVIYIIGYNTLNNDIDYLSNIEFNYLILDEAQYIKNISANKTKSVKMLDAKHRFALSGTPIENNVIDLWSIFDFIMPEYLDSLDNYKNRYLHDDRYTDILAKKISLFILRRRKEDVLKDLPPKIERIISVDMTDTQRKLYDAYKLEANKALEEGNSSFQMLPYITRLRQICVDPLTYIENYNGGSGKTNEVIDLIDKYIRDGHRILLFSSFVQALKIIEIKLFNSNIKYLRITGETDSKERIKLVDEFNSNNQYKVFLISLKAGGTGLNLVGADTVIHLDPWWNVSAENQATDRAHRIGQKRMVEVIKVVCDDSIEQRVIELQNIKKDIVDKLIAKDDSSITSLSLDDLNYILR